MLRAKEELNYWLANHTKWKLKEAGTSQSGAQEQEAGKCLMCRFLIAK
jgi:hypothetical protein